MTVLDFSFDEHSAHFDAHIGASIPGYDRLGWWIEKFSRRFIQSGTRVIDIGCSTGTMLRSVRDANQVSRPCVDYVGIDVAPGFQQHWCQHSAEGLRFEVRDALSFDGFDNMSLAIASFTVQFIAERYKMGLLQRVYDGLVEGGALLIAEKTLASSSTLQELIAFSFYDHKLATFSAEEILDKERRLRGLMTPWTRARLVEALRAVGFHAEYIEGFWQDGPFIGLVAMKRETYTEIARPRLIAA